MIEGENAWKMVGHVGEVILDILCFQTYYTHIDNNRSERGSTEPESI